MNKYKYKLSNELMEFISNNKEEKASVYVWLKDDSSVYIDKELRAMGYNIESYISIENFEKYREPQLVKDIGEDIAYKLSNENDNLIERYIDKAIRTDINEYYKNFIELSEKFFSSTNIEILHNNLGVDDSEIVYVCKLIPLAILRVDIKKLYKFLENEMVERISLFRNYELKNEMEIAEQQVKADYLKKKEYLSEYGYKGRNVKIGMIEYKNDKEKHIEAVKYLINGKCIEKDGISYEGIASCANLVCKEICKEEEFIQAIEELIKDNVHVINMSAGISEQEDHENEYSDIDKAIDNFIYKYKVNFIKSAGNNEKITIPGRAFNSIVVGNVETKEKLVAKMVSKPEPYRMRMNSGYKQPSYIANKPDLSAPGTEIYIPEIGHKTGTSFSAPLVTGVVAQIIEANSKYILNPNLIKAILMLSSNSSIITDDNEIHDSVFLKERSGAGMLNALAAIKLCENLDLHFKEFTFCLDGEEFGKEIYVDLKKLKKGSRLEAILIYDKADDLIINGKNNIATDLDLYFESLKNGICEQSLSYSNVEVIKTVIKETDKYNFMIYPYYLNDTSDKRNLNACLLWKVI